MKQMAIAAVLGLILIPLLTLEASALPNTKDAGFEECLLWCSRNRSGDERDKCEQNCACYYQEPSCGLTAPPGSITTAPPQKYLPPATAPSPGGMRREPFPSHQGIMPRGVEGETPAEPTPSAPAPTEQPSGTK
jgi:hypothetical protein